MTCAYPECSKKERKKFWVDSWHYIEYCDEHYKSAKVYLALNDYEAYLKKKEIEK